jgi:transposase-like protein
MIRRKNHWSKEQIISEYLTGDEGFRALGEKYGVKARTIQTWVRAYRKRAAPLSVPGTSEGEKSVEQLQKQLKQAQLKNELLEEMLRLSEEHTGLDLRKKFGTKQS